MQKGYKARKYKENEDFKGMIKILFVCHGNICRSPMAEFLFKDYVTKKGAADSFFIASAATSTEEIGNPVHHGTREKLAPLGISVKGKTAVQMTKADYQKYDYLIGMDSWNIRNMLRIVGNDSQHKIYSYLDFTEHPHDIADPWYTGNFDETYEDICEGMEGFYAHLRSINPKLPK